MKISVINCILIIYLLATFANASDQLDKPADEELSSAKSNSNPSITIISTAKDVVNILFFVAVGTVGILSYLQARKTVFTPLRTEVFKLQLQALQEVLLFFEKHPSANIEDEFDYSKIVQLNSLRMMDSYTFLFFSDKINKEHILKIREPLFSDLIGAVVSQDFMMKHFKSPEAVRVEKNSDEKRPDSPALMLAEWNDYDHGMIEYTNKYKETTEKIRRFKSSPLLPKELKDLIRFFEKKESENLWKIGVVLSKTAKELPIKYPNVKSLEKCDLTWIWNVYNKEKESLTNHQDNILEYLNRYLNIDSVLPTGRDKRGI